MGLGIFGPRGAFLLPSQSKNTATQITREEPKIEVKETKIIGEIVKVRSYVFESKRNEEKRILYVIKADSVIKFGTVTKPDSGKMYYGVGKEAFYINKVPMKDRPRLGDKIEVTLTKVGEELLAFIEWVPNKDVDGTISFEKKLWPIIDTYKILERKELKN